MGERARSRVPGPLATAWAERKNFDPRIWLLTYGQLVLSIGRGVLMPFATLYFYNERGFPLALLGLAFAVALPTGALVGLFWGALSDRIGRKPLMVLGFTGASVTSVGMAFVGSPAEYFALVVLQAIGMGAWNPSARAMVADVTPAERRTRAYGLLYLSNNAGISLGLLLGGLLAIALPYRMLFFIEAAGFAGYLLVVMLFVRESRAREARSTDASALGRVVEHLRSVAVPLRDARFLLFALAGILAGFGWAQFYLTYSPYMANVLGASDAWIGVMFAINTVMVVVLQVPTAAWAETRRRTRVYLIATYLLAWSMLLTWGAGRAASASLEAALLLMGVGIAVMTIGEMIVVPVGSALVSGLAGGPEHFGKYMAAFDLVWTLATGLGGVVGGWFFDRGQPILLWPVVTIFVVLSLAAYAWLGRMLPPEVESPGAKPPVKSAEASTRPAAE